MEIKLMREFITLAETCSFQEAAERLYISASSLSKHVKAMETELGVPLFDRSTRSVKLSRYGETFCEYARQMVKLYDACGADLELLRESHDSRLSIGFLPKFEPSGIIEMLSDFSREHPELTVHMVATNQPLELLLSRRCNFVFTNDARADDPSISSFLYRAADLVAVFSRSHPLAGEASVTVEQLRGEDLIMHSDHSGEATAAAETFRSRCLEAGFVPKVAISASYASSAVKLARKGSGVAILNRMFVPDALGGDVAVVDIVPEIPLSIYVLRLSRTRMFPAEREFLRYVKARADQG